MTIHRTKTGYVEFVASWRDGEPPKKASPVAHFTVRDDVTTAIWKFTGTLRDAAETVCQIRLCRPLNDCSVAILEGAHVEIKQAPDDFWINNGDDFIPNLDRYPNVVAF